MLTDFANRIVTTAELRAHGGYASAWIAINGVVYDITRFIPKHPFGDTFRGHLGTECGGLFSSAHTATRVEALLADDAFRKRHEIALVGRLDLADGRLDGTGGHPYLERLGYRDTAADAFWLELKGRVATYLKEQGETTHYSNTVGALYLIYYLSIYVLLSWLTWVQGSFLAAVLLGFHMICALALFAVYCVAYSQTAFLLLFNDHEETHAPLGDQQDLACLHGKPSWAEVQVRTSGNWYPTNWLLAFVEFHYGYFNYHIEHHLFPTFKPSLLKRISPIVRRVCRAHGVPYICTPFFDVQQSLARHLYAMGTAPRASGRGSQGHL